MMGTGTKHEILEIGVVSPKPQKCDGLSVGEVGYLITGVKDVRQSKAGDTVTSAKNGAVDALPGKADPTPMMYSGLFPMSQEDYPDLRAALEKLQLNDASEIFEPETSATSNVVYRVVAEDGTEKRVSDLADSPDAKTFEI